MRRTASSARVSRLSVSYDYVNSDIEPEKYKIVNFCFGFRDVFVIFKPEISIPKQKIQQEKFNVVLVSLLLSLNIFHTFSSVVIVDFQHAGWNWIDFHNEIFLVRVLNGVICIKFYFI